MIGSPSSVLTMGLGLWGSPSLLVTLGYGTETVVPTGVTPDIKFALPNRSMNCTLSSRAMQFALPKRNLNTTARQR